MLEKLRGKRMIIVGDSLNRNQFESMACLLYTGLKPSQAHVGVNGGSYKVLRAKVRKWPLEFSIFLFYFSSNGRHLLLEIFQFDFTAFTSPIVV